jgi:L,D-peptidoglycan transpeptidase YkuD (ErfK/YbiS/YcfS/YnhG family)
MNSTPQLHMKSKASSVGYTMNRSAGPLSAIRVKPAAGNPRRGWLTAGSLIIPVALGRGGILANKREGDGGTPRGSFRPRRLWWRGDRHSRPQSFLPTRIITAADAWCEDPRDRHYNQAIRLGPAQAGRPSL